MTEYYPSILIVAVGVLGYALHALRRREASPAVIWPREMTVRLHVESEDRPRLPQPEKNSDALSNALGDESAETGPDEATKPLRLVVDSLTLLTAYHYLLGERSRDRTGTFREVFVYLGGVRVDGRTLVISHLLPVEYAVQRGWGVHVSQPDNIALLTALDELQLELVGHAHSHPGRFGMTSTQPSATDRRFQARLEKGGCRVIGLIFARHTGKSAYVRFFTGEEMDFQVEVQGAHVQRVEDHVYKLSLEHDQLPVGTVVAR